MSEVRWDLLAAYPNPGEAFAKGWQDGQEKARQAATKRAIAALLGNPRDPQAMSALAINDPDSALKFRQIQSNDQKALSETMKMGGNMIVRAKQLNPELSDEQAYAGAVQTLRQMGAPGADRAPPFTPEFFSNVVSMADQQEGPSSVREYEYAKQNGYRGSFTDFLRDYKVSPLITGSGDTIDYGGGGTQSPPPPPPEAIEDLRRNPGLAAQFDLKYGQGHSESILGNGGPAGSGSPEMFPRY